MAKSAVKNVHIGKCALCDTENLKLRESHIIPKFVFDWLKSTSKTPYVRASDNVNSRLQDGLKDYLLCGTCEGNLSSMEGKIARNLFKKLANYRLQPSSITVTESMRVGVLSIFWRALFVSRNRDSTRTDEDNTIYDSFLSSLKNQIYAGQCNTRIYFSPFWGNPPYYDLPNETTYQLERAIGGQDISFFDNPHRFFATFKLPFVYFYIFSDGWAESETAKSAELIAGDIMLDKINDIPDVLRTYIRYMNAQFTKSKMLMNSENLDKIEAEIKKNPNIMGSDKSMARMLGIKIEGGLSGKKQEE